MRYAGWSTCYRREAGSAGKDTRGIIRVHQFNKLEMFVYTTQEEAEAEHARLLAWEEQMLAAIEVPYRVIDTAAGDLGLSAPRKFDREAWGPPPRSRTSGRRRARRPRPRGPSRGRGARRQRAAARPPRAGRRPPPPPPPPPASRLAR
ncbi:aminoacyl--tRNA ligase-related protein, partial [Salmonella enterica]|uniref:aminoacyl--tRNA ligase-related protein n=1 Tax=Salmonella enterica TaxID=28901 RepID=UPI003221BE51